MKVILVADVKGLGKRGEVKEVAPGYGRNFLLPRQLVVQATKGNLAALQQQQRRTEEREQEKKGIAERLAGQLEGSTVKVPLRTGQGGKAFGVVKASHICQAISAQHGIELDKRVIRLAEPLRSLGVLSLQLHLHPAHKATIQVHVVPSKES